MSYKPNGHTDLFLKDSFNKTLVGFKFAGDNSNLLKLSRIQMYRQADFMKEPHFRNLRFLKLIRSSKFKIFFLSANALQFSFRNIVSMKK